MREHLMKICVEFRCHEFSPTDYAIVEKLCSRCKILILIKLWLLGVMIVELGKIH